LEAKIEDCGDLIDEPTAAMMVVGELGREHVKIKGLFAKSSLFSFFGKVIDKTEPKEFDRADGEEGLGRHPPSGGRDRHNPRCSLGREGRGCAGYRGRGRA